MTSSPNNSPAAPGIAAPGIAALGSYAGTAAAGATGRLLALDRLRGVVMILMAIDHVRVFAGVPAGGAQPGVFFTRWVTHFCAPVFVMLAGTGISLSALTRTDARAARIHLLVRGLVLVLLDLTINRFSWTFNLDFAGNEVVNIFSVIGVSTMLLALLLPAPRWLMLLLGVLVVAGHNLLDQVPAARIDAIAASPFGGLWQLLYGPFGEFRLLGFGPRTVVLFTLVPWVGVMALGFSFGPIVRLDASQRRRWCMAIGVGAMAAFVLLRASSGYGNPTPWDPTTQRLPPLLAFLAVAKYPASLQFLLMTLGPAIALLPALDRANGWVGQCLATFGRVPLAYYVLHLPLIHVLAVIVSAVRTPADTGWLFLNHPLRNPPPPAGYPWSLPLLYAVTALAVALLYPVCRWYARRKQNAPTSWFARYL